MNDPRPITVTPARLALKVLSGDDARRLHEASVELLGAAGAAAAAAAVAAPSSFALAGRVPEHDVAAGDGCVRLVAGAPLHPAGRVRSLSGGDPVPGTAADLDAACRLADVLPEVAVVASPPLRAAGETALGELARCFAGTSKHLMTGALTSAAEAEAAVAMATAVGGSADEARRRPPLSFCGGADAIEPALVFSRAGLPTGFVAPALGDPAAASGSGDPAEATDPVAASDVAAALTRHHAGVLAACAAVQAAAPGAPFLYVADPSLAGLPAAGPEAALFQIACVQLAARVGLPVVAAGMLTGSHEPDWQACTQNAFASLGAAAAAAALTAGAGTLGGGTAFSLQQLVMDTEIHSWNAYIAGGITVDEETIALDAIRQVDICGNFLSQRHTRRHMKDVWRPRLLDRTAWDAWVAGGREGPYEKATALAERLLAEHEVAPLGGEVSGKLRRIIAEAGLYYPHA